LKRKIITDRGAFLGHTPTTGDETQPGQLPTACAEQGRQ